MKPLVFIIDNRPYRLLVHIEELFSLADRKIEPLVESQSQLEPIFFASGGFQCPQIFLNFRS